MQVAEPEGYRQVFWNLGEEVHALLLRQRERGTAQPQLLTELLDRTVVDAPATLPLPAELAASLTDLPHDDLDSAPEPAGTDVVTRLGLTPREREVLRAVAAGASNRQIADELYVSVNTVKSQVRSVYRKLDVSRRGDAVRRARHLGLL